MEGDMSIGPGAALLILHIAGSGTSKGGKAESVAAPDAQDHLAQDQPQGGCGLALAMLAVLVLAGFGLFLVSMWER